MMLRLCCVLFSSALPILQAEEIEVTDLSRLQVENGRPETTTYRGSKALKLTETFASAIADP